MSELYHMSDAVEITECEGTGRMVSLVGSQLTTSPAEDEVRTLSICALSIVRLSACRWISLIIMSSLFGKLR